MGKLDDYEFKGLPEEMSDFKDDVTSIVNGGKYSSQVVNFAPEWTANNGESAFYFSGNTTRYYFYVNDQWNNLEFNTALVSSWLVFSGTGNGAILDSFGVSSVTALGTGDYQITWSTAFSDNTYGLAGATKKEGIASFVVNLVNTANNPSRASVRIKTAALGGAGQNINWMCLVATGLQTV